MTTPLTFCPRARALSSDMKSASGQYKCLNEAEPFTGYIKCRKCLPSLSRPQPDIMVVKIPSRKWLNWQEAAFAISLIVFWHCAFIEASGISMIGRLPQSANELIQSMCLCKIETTWDNRLSPRAIS